MKNVIFLTIAIILLGGTLIGPAFPASPDHDQIIASDLKQITFQVA